MLDVLLAAKDETYENLKTKTLTKTLQLWDGPVQ